MPETSAEYRLWRAFVPQWGHLPLSGEGAARFGGRWNPKGVPAIYAALEMSTAWAEYNQGFVQHPALIAQLELSGARLVDLRDDATLYAMGVSEKIHHCEWRDMLDRGTRPPTYALMRRLLKQGWHGVIYPSAMSPGGNCVALWRWNDKSGVRLTVVDPEHRLPKDQASWL